jgi:hypothetical protein
LNYFFSNMGNQSALIEDVGIYEFVLNSPYPSMSAAENFSASAASAFHVCEDAISLRPDMLTFSPPEAANQWMSIGIKGRVSLRPYQPVKIYVDGAEEKTSSVTVEAGKMRAIATTFKMDSVPRDEYYNTVVICPVIRLFDSKGPVFAVCDGWQSTWAGDDAMRGPPPVAPPARLLPVSSMGSCHSVRGFAGMAIGNLGVPHD